jgi:hypothetical protein
VLRPRDIKKALMDSGLVQNGLFAWGTIPEGTKAWEIVLSVVTLAFGSYFLLPSKGVVVGFTFVDDALIITPTNDETVLTESAIRITKKDVKEVTLKRNRLGEVALVVIDNDNERSEYHVIQPVKTMERMVELFNSQ